MRCKNVKGGVQNVILGQKSDSETDRFTEKLEMMIPYAI